MPDINNRASEAPQFPSIIIYAYNFGKELSELVRALVYLRVIALPRARHWAPSGHKVIV